MGLEERNSFLWASNPPKCRTPTFLARFDVSGAYFSMIGVLVVFYFAGVVFGKKPSDYSACTAKLNLGDSCSIDVDDPRIHPTQALVGTMEVDCKRSRYESMSKSDLESYLDTHALPAVISPSGEFYITDHHHLAMALATSSASTKTVVLNIISVAEETYSLSEFFQMLVQNNLTYPYDEKMNLINPLLIPESIMDLVPYAPRSLAWAVRNNGGYAETSIYFADFLWAAAFVSKGLVPLHPTNKTTLFCSAAPTDPLCSTQSILIKNALPAALSFASSPAAAYLPGYGKGVVDYPDCGNSTIAF